MYLIEDGKAASINEANKDSLTPLKFANKYNKTEVAAYLKSKGGTM